MGGLECENGSGRTVGRYLVIREESSGEAREKVLRRLGRGLDGGGGAK